MKGMINQLPFIAFVSLFSIITSDGETDQLEVRQNSEFSMFTMPSRNSANVSDLCPKVWPAGNCSLNLRRFPVNVTGKIGYYELCGKASIWTRANCLEGKYFDFQNGLCTALSEVVPVSRSCWQPSSTTSGATSSSSTSMSTARATTWRIPAETVDHFPLKGRRCERNAELARSSKFCNDSQHGNYGGGADGIPRDCCLRVMNQRVLQINSSREAGIFLIQLQQLTGNVNHSKDADLETMIDLLDQAGNRIVDNVSGNISDLIKPFVTSASNFLASGWTRAWTRLSQEKSNASARLLRSMESVSSMVNRTVGGGALSVNTSNIVLSSVSVPVKESVESIKIPENNEQLQFVVQVESLRKLGIVNGVEQISLSSLKYENLHKLLPAYHNEANSYVASKVMALKINTRHSDEKHVQMEPPVLVRLQYERRNTSDLWRPECAHWDFSAEGWATSGCSLTSTDRNSVTCQCSHLTNFAVIMTSSPLPARHQRLLNAISLVAICISIIALILTIAVYATLWKLLKAAHTIVLVNLCVALLAADLVFLLGIERTENTVVCAVVAVGLHYLFLVVMFMMLVEGCQLLLYLVIVFPVQRRLHTFLMILSAYLIPLVIVAISLGATKADGYGNSKFCWLSKKHGLIWAFVAPSLGILFVNIVILAMCMNVLSKARKSKPSSRKVKYEYRTALWNVVVLTPLLGMTWLLGLFVLSSNVVFFHYLFAIFNSLQGFFIFVFHCIFNKKIREAFKKDRETSNSLPSWTRSFLRPRRTQRSSMTKSSFLRNSRSRNEHSTNLPSNGDGSNHLASCRQDQELEGLASSQ